MNKTDNEYILDGKRYVRTVGRCVCAERLGDRYLVSCKIPNRGFHFYAFTPGTPRIRGNLANLSFWLSEEALEVIRESVSGYDRKVSAVKEGPTADLICDRSRFRVCCRLNAGESRPLYVLEYADGEEIYQRYIDDENATERLLTLVAARYILENNTVNARKTENSIVHGVKETVDDNPVYSAALRNPDPAFAALLRVYYGFPSHEDCRLLDGRFGWKVLPEAAEEYDAEYVVDADTADFGLLKRSNYYFRKTGRDAMGRQTHAKVVINPHFRYVRDAAPAAAPGISFDAFLKKWGAEGEDGGLRSEGDGKKEEQHGLCDE